MFSVAKAKRQLQMFYLCESEATATNVLSVRKRSESEATATNVLSVRKRSDSYKCFICAKAKRQQQSAQPEWKSTTRYADKSKIKCICAPTE
ncbi:hypothetical protein ACQKMV_02605 [Lysinibacillus sp. NPDC094403]|uniref:hypothetical protein n=1 Tax=Lysinibacillus sp. NPDC094403 TaxID=3390581 RepID=UPI003CFE6B3B